MVVTVGLDQGRLHLPDREIGYRIRYKRRRTIGLYVLEDGTVEVRAPQACPPGLIRAFVADRAGWLQRVLTSRAQQLTPEPARYDHGATHPYLGEQLQLELRPARRALVHRDGTSLVVQHPRRDPDAVAGAVKHWYQRQAESVFLPLLEQWYPHLGLPAAKVPGLKVRTMRRRWGSCSSRGGINLNIWLLRAPIDCVEYVVIHELCHLREFNHGPRFHGWMDRLLPDWRERSGRLNEHQRRFGVAPIPAAGADTA